VACTGSFFIQPQVNSLVVAQKFNHALRIIENNKEGYGPKNRLLYELDYGLVLHLAGRYEESIRVLDQAKRSFDRLFTISLSTQAGTWLMNDNFAPYRGEDYERAMINIFQALNYINQNDIEEALVEARDVDVKLNLFNQSYHEGEKNVYKEDAFIRLLVGILYEASGTQENLNDAFISYQKAVEIYEHDFYPHYGVVIPKVLKENILAVAQRMGNDEYNFYKDKFGDIEFKTIAEKQERAEVYVIHYQGYSPIKRQSSIPIPLPGGYIAKLAFPRYDERISDTQPKLFQAVRDDKSIYEATTELGEDISAIALENLKRRQLRVIAKATLRSAGKQFAARAAAEQIEVSYGKTQSNWFKYAASLYNISSEQVDLRSWQTLPGQIHIARLILEPETYELFLNDRSLGIHSVKAGTKKFLTVRTK